MQIELTPEQAQALLQLIDMAVKSGGLNVAKPAYDIAAIVQTALNEHAEAPVADEA